MLQRFARSKASGKHIWQSLSSSLECSGVCQCSTSSGAAAAEELGDVGLGLERRLKQRINVDIANLSKPPDPRPVYAGVVIERYPICFPAPAPWRVEHKEWNLQWNKWKFRQVTDEQMSADKQNIDDSSAEVRVVSPRTTHHRVGGMFAQHKGVCAGDLPTRVYSHRGRP